MNSVGRAAQSVVLEVRRQFREITGLMDGKADPDYARCVDLCTKASLHEMILPTIIAVVCPSWWVWSWATWALWVCWPALPSPAS